MLIDMKNVYTVEYRKKIHVWTTQRSFNYKHVNPYMYIIYMIYEHSETYEIINILSHLGQG